MKVTEQATLNLELARPSDTTPVWVSSNPEVCTIAVAEGGYSAEVTAVSVGSAQVDARTNCDFGSGVREHHTTFNIVVDNDDIPDEVVEVDSKEEPASPYWNADPSKF